MQVHQPNLQHLNIPTLAHIEQLVLFGSGVQPLRANLNLPEVIVRSKSSCVPHYPYFAIKIRSPSSCLAARCLPIYFFQHEDILHRESTTTPPRALIARDSATQQAVAAQCTRPTPIPKAASTSGCTITASMSTRGHLSLNPRAGPPGGQNLQSVSNLSQCVAASWCGPSRVANSTSTLTREFTPVQLASLAADVSQWEAFKDSEGPTPHFPFNQLRCRSCLLRALLVNRIILGTFHFSFRHHADTQ
jgi:hypothetical protein